jgi:prolyl-tRNA synthetase
MSDPVQEVITRLSKLSIKPHAVVSHTATSSPATWREALQNAKDVPTKYELTKTLVFKPKTAKGAAPIPVVVIAREETETSSAALGKKLNLKDLRLASEDILTTFFGVDKDSGE